MVLCANSGKLAAFILFMLIGSTAGAQDTSWIIRGAGVYSVTASDRSVSVVTLPPPMTQETTTLSITDGPGLGVGLEYLLSRKWGIEFAVLVASHDADSVVVNDSGSFAATDSLGLRTFTIGANYYFPADGRARWSVGGFLAETFSDDVTFAYPAIGRTEILAFDGDYGLGVKAGVDWPFAPDSRWTFSLEARYLSTILETESGASDLDLNPFILTVGVGYRF